MNRDDIIRMVHESATHIEDYEKSDEMPEDVIEFFMRFAELVAAAEHETCEVLFNERVAKSLKVKAKIGAFNAAIKAEREVLANLVEQMGIEGYGTLAIAAAIRARGEQ
jgi:hypothetical protein